MTSTTYIKTGTVKTQYKPKVRTNLVKQMETKALNKYSTFRILQHLYKRHEITILYAGVFTMFGLILWSKLG